MRNQHTELLMITALYASILGLLWFVLTFWVILGRWKYRVSLGDGQERDLNRRIRAHANFVETVPLALILLWCVESHAFHEPLCHVFGVGLCASRILHAAGMLFPRRTTNILRQIGMGTTMTVMTCAALWLLGAVGLGIVPT